MKAIVLYIHGRGGSAAESEHYRPLFPGCEVLGLDYRSSTPREAGRELREAVEEFKKEYESITLVANSIGAFFSLCAGIDALIERAYFLSPVVDLERLIGNMLARSGVTEERLRAEGVIMTASGEELSWAVLCYVREHPVKWEAPTEILYGSRDDLTSYETIETFAKAHGARLTVMEGGEHWFHTDGQLRFLDEWLLGTLPPLTIAGERWRLLRLLGKGKGGYSYLAENEGKQAVVKQLHHEPCDYYTFGNKIEAELRDYERLQKAEIRIPALLSCDRDAERLVKDYIEGPTVMELLRSGASAEPYLPQVRDMAAKAMAAGLNIDYYPTNFVVRDGLLWYVDYECNDYSEQWDFEHWGLPYWQPKVRFRAYRDEDYEAVCAFLIELNREDRTHINWNWARFEWMMEHPEFDKSARSAIGLWWAEEKVVGAAIYDMYFGEAFCGALPAYAALVPEILDYACRELKDESGLAVAINRENTAEIRAAEQAGFEPIEQSETVMELSLDRPFSPTLPEGFTLREMDQIADREALEWLFWQGFDHGDDREAFERSLSPEPHVRRHFNKALCLSAAAPSGEPVSHCSLWFHPDTDYAYVEPVCTVPGYRGKGIAAALLSEAFSRAKALGARKAYVISDLPFYEKLGFAITQRYPFFRKSPET